MLHLEYRLNKEPEPLKLNSVQKFDGLTGIERATRSLDQIIDSRYRHHL